MDISSIVLLVVLVGVVAYSLFRLLQGKPFGEPPPDNPDLKHWYGATRNEESEKDPHHDHQIDQGESHDDDPN